MGNEEKGYPFWCGVGGGYEGVLVVRASRFVRLHVSSWYY